MGPRFCKRGNPRHLADHLLVNLLASMGPRFCKRGNLFIPHLLPRSYHASMGPRFCKRGNQRALSDLVGATSLQWGHAFVSVETAEELDWLSNQTDASMGPRFCKRGNHAHAGVRRLASSAASMGPRFCKRGNTTLHRADGRHALGFNGATLL